MAGRYLATELQDENGDVIYPHTETDIVFGSDGTTVEENLSGDVTDADIEEVFSSSQFETGKKLSVKEKIKKALKRYQALLSGKILDTVEEVEANTDEGYLMGARAGAELINDLKFPDGTGFYPDEKNGVRGYNTDAARGADTFSPFKSKLRYYIGAEQNPGIGGRATVKWTTTFNLSSVYDGYKNITKDDIYASVYKYGGGGSQALSSNVSVVFDKISSYDPDTGIIEAQFDIYNFDGRISITIIPVYIVVT